MKITRDQFAFSEDDIPLDKPFDQFIEYSQVNHLAPDHLADAVDKLSFQ